LLARSPINHEAPGGTEVAAFGGSGPDGGRQPKAAQQEYQWLKMLIFKILRQNH
jgi:hypothetical protein